MSRSNRCKSTLLYVRPARNHPASPAIVPIAHLRERRDSRRCKSDHSAQVAIKIATASGKSFPSLATGSLVGMEKNGVLEITNSFPFPEAAVAHVDPGHSNNNNQNDKAADLAAGAPRAKQNIAYGNEMIKFLREVNVDANNVGWYTSTSMGNFINLNTIENQFYYQNQLNERTVALIYDVSRSSQGTLNLRAYRLSPAFVTAYKEGKFTTER
jgi:translation initiation factor 3 subunit H